MLNSTGLKTVVLYGRWIAAFLDEFEWYANALRRARDHGIAKT